MAIVPLFTRSAAERWSLIDGMFAELYSRASVSQPYVLAGAEICEPRRFSHLETMATDLAGRFGVSIVFDPFAQDVSNARRTARLNMLMSALYAASGGGGGPTGIMASGVWDDNAAWDDGAPWSG